MNRIVERLKSHRLRERLVGYVLILLVLVSIVMSVGYAQQQREISQCQVRVNQEFLAVLKSNSQLAQADRENLAKLVQEISLSSASPEAAKAAKALEEAETPEEGLKAVKAIVRASNSDQGSRAALKHYQERKAQIDAQRQSYPALPRDVCE